MPASCSNCSHHRDGHCHRYPPTVVLTADNRSHSVWPGVKEDDRCGEHNPLIAPPPSWHSTDVQHHAFSTRARKAFLAAGILTLLDLANRKKELGAMRNVGRGTVDHIEEVFSRLTGELLNAPR